MRAKSANWKTGCSVEVALSVIGGIWKLVIVFHPLDRKIRFGELSRLLPHATQRMLTLPVATQVTGEPQTILEEPNLRSEIITLFRYAKIRLRALHRDRKTEAELVLRGQTKRKPRRNIQSQGISDVSRSGPTRMASLACAWRLGRHPDRRRNIPHQVGMLQMG